MDGMYAGFAGAKASDSRDGMYAGFAGAKASHEKITIFRGTPSKLIILPVCKLHDKYFGNR